MCYNIKTIFLETSLNSSAVNELVETLFSCESKEDLFEFLEDVATTRELNEMAGRWKAAKLLSKNTPYRKVSELTGLSTATVTRVASWLNNGAGGYKKALAKIHHSPKG